MIRKTAVQKSRCQNFGFGFALETWLEGSRCTSKYFKRLQSCHYVGTIKPRFQVAFTVAPFCLFELLFIMGNAHNSKVAALESFLKDHPYIKFITSSSPDYISLRAVFSLDSTATPLAIVRPQSASDVALLVSYAKSNGIKFVIRIGGHNIFGLSIVEGALTIDMRDISYVNIDKQNSTARIGEAYWKVNWWNSLRRRVWLHQLRV